MIQKRTEFIPFFFSFNFIENILFIFSVFDKSGKRLIYDKHDK